MAEQQLRRQKSKPQNDSNDRRNDRRASIKDILISLQREADNNYNGQLSDNALTIFNMLSVGEKRTFLRHAISMLYNDLLERSMRNEVDDVDIDPDLKIDFSQVTKERADFGDIEKIEHLKFVNFFTRLLFVILLLLFIAFSYFVMTYGVENPGQAILEKLVDILDAVLAFWKRELTRVALPPVLVFIDYYLKMIRPG